LVVAGLLLAGVWVVLAGPGDPSSWLIGAPAVIAAAWSRQRLSAADRPRLSVPGALRFLPYFVVESFKGGIDVALRVIGPRVRVDPGLVDYRLSLTRPTARVFFADLVSLLPGTLSADLRGNLVSIHALDRGIDPVPELRRLERRVAALFREPPPAPVGPAP
jgi:multicomponent Na+:H+ antiporter subunit E